MELNLRFAGCSRFGDWRSCPLYHLVRYNKLKVSVRVVVVVAVVVPSLLLGPLLG